jgi:hypothetical protein
MANLVYNKGLEELGKALTDLDASDLRMLLVQSTYTANKDHLTVDDGTANDPASHEVSVSGYGRQALANKVVTRDDTNDFAYLDADDVVFVTLATGQTVGGAVLFRHTGADGTAVLIGFYDLADTPTNGGNITVQFNTPANGGALKLESL